jgi:hypothetical protein
MVVACSGESSDGIPGGGPPDGGSADGGVDAATLVVVATDFDQSCTTANDCVAVYTGNACALCTCQNEAISKTSLAAYDAKWNELVAACGQRPGIGCEADCVSPALACTEGKCALGAPR